MDTFVVSSPGLLINRYARNVSEGQHASVSLASKYVWIGLLGT